jgi:ankyrin repeat protein
VLDTHAANWPVFAPPQWPAFTLPLTISFKMVIRDAHNSVNDLLAYLGDSITEFLGVNLDDVNKKGIFGDTPLLIVIMQETSDHVALEEAKLLIAGGADVNLTGEMDETPLHAAAQSGRLDIAKLLVSSGAVSGVRDEFGRTAYDLAKRMGFDELAKFLKESEPK